MKEIFETIKSFNEDYVEYFKPLGDLEILEAESSLGIKLPEEYISFLKFSNGIIIDGDEVLGIRNKKYDLIQSYNNEHFGVKIPMFNYIVPFSPDGRGNFYCFDKSDGDMIVFWVSNYDYNEKEKPEKVYCSFKDWFQEVMINWTIENNDDDLYKK